MLYCAIKKVLPFIIILLFVFKTGQGQTNVYHPFPDSNAVWSESYWYQNYYSSGYPPCNVVCPNIVFLTGDTTISTIHYKKILGSGYCSCMGSTSGYYYNTYKGAIRQDSVHKKVYYCAPSTSTDTLLYNFNLSVGDTLLASYINFSGSNYVSSIDSILIGTSYRKQYHISAIVLGCCDSNYVQLIEGIGSTFGLGYLISPSSGESGSTLNCFSQNNVTLYPSTADSCYLTLGIKTLNRQLIFNISPNPSSGTISIAGNITIDELKVSDMLGQIVYEAKPNATNTTLILTDAGIYFITLTSGTATSTKKVIVAK